MIEFWIDLNLAYQAFLIDNFMFVLGLVLTINLYSTIILCYWTWLGYRHQDLILDLIDNEWKEYYKSNRSTV